MNSYFQILFFTLIVCAHDTNYTEQTTVLINLVVYFVQLGLINWPCHIITHYSDVIMSTMLSQIFK